MSDAQPTPAPGQYPGAMTAAGSRAVWDVLSQGLAEGQVPGGSLAAVARTTGVNPNSVRSIFRRYFAHHYPGRNGRPAPPPPKRKPRARKPKPPRPPKKQARPAPKPATPPPARPGRPRRARETGPPPSWKELELRARATAERLLSWEEERCRVFEEGIAEGQDPAQAAKRAGASQSTQLRSVAIAGGVFNTKAQENDKGAAAVVHVAAPPSGVEAEGIFVQPKRVDPETARQQTEAPGESASLRAV